MTTATRVNAEVLRLDQDCQEREDNIEPVTTTIGAREPRHPTSDLILIVVHFLLMTREKVREGEDNHCDIAMHCDLRYRPHCCSFSIDDERKGEKGRRRPLIFDLQTNTNYNPKEILLIHAFNSEEAT